MNPYNSPSYSTPGAEYADQGYHYDSSKYYDYKASPSPTPSPRHQPFYAGQQTPRPATRAHYRHVSSGGYDGFSPRPGTAFSPRYTSDGHYATATANGYPQEKMYPSVSVRYEELPPRSATRVQHHRRQSYTQQPQQPPPQRPSTARPGSSHHSSKKPAPAAKATEADAKRHHIPAGYSLKNWDPTEEPIMLLGSVFDANSLGKWIYDWTVYHHQPSHPISDIAGEMWLLLIQLAGKMKRSEEVMPRVRSKENRDMIEDFIESGERLTDKLRKLLKTCESPMLKASKRNAQLGKNSGVEFVKTLFGREQELEKTEKFMQAVRLWNLRFDANCEAILKNPTL